MRKKAIIVDPFSSGVEYAKKFREFGISCLAVISKKNLHSSLLASFNEKDFEAIYKWEEDHSQNSELLKEKPVTVLAGSESGVLLAESLAQVFGTPSNDFFKTLARRDKWEMVKVLKDSGLRVISSLEAKNLEEILRWAKQMRLGPLVLKPIRSGGSDGVKVCRSEGEIKTAFNSIFGGQNILGEKNLSVLVQEFIDGTEYVVDSVSKGGRHYISAIWKYMKSIQSDMSVVYDTLEILPRRGDVQDALVSYHLKVLDALGFKNGPAHNEYFIDGNGPVLVESAARPHGGVGGPFIGRLVTGMNQVDLVASGQMQTGLFDMVTSRDYRKNCYAVEVFLKAPKDGKLSAPFPLDAFEELESFHDFRFYSQKGDRILKTRDLVSSPGRLILVSSEERQIREDMKKAREIESHLFTKLIN